MYTLVDTVLKDQKDFTSISIYKDSKEVENDEEYRALAIRDEDNVYHMSLSNKFFYRYALLRMLFTAIDKLRNGCAIYFYDLSTGVLHSVDVITLAEFTELEILGCSYDGDNLVAEFRS